MATYTGASIVDYLKSIGQPSDYASRTVLAKQKGITNYAGTAKQNTQLLNILRGGIVSTPISTLTPTSPVTFGLQYPTTPTVAPTPTPAPTPTGQTYTVKAGDTLYDIYGPNWKQLSGYTGDPTKLQIGTVLPAPPTGGQAGQTAQTDTRQYIQDPNNPYASIPNPNYVPPTTGGAIPTSPVSPTVSSVTGQITDVQGQVADLQAQQAALTQYGLTDTNQLTKDASGNYVPITPSTTGNPDLDAILEQMNTILNTIVAQGQKVNPDIELTPAEVQAFLDQASTEIDPYYKSQFEAIKGNLSSNLTYLQKQYDIGQKQKEASFIQSLATGRETAAGAGTIFSGQRAKGEQLLAQAQGRELTAAGLSAEQQAGGLARTAEQQIGTRSLADLGLPTFSMYAPTTVGQGAFTLGGRMPYFTPGAVTGTMEREQQVAKLTRQSELEQAERAKRSLQFYT